MCTILLAWRCLDDAAYVLAANRDELLARPAAPPGPLSEAPPIYGGRDLLAGGTWLAVTPGGRLAAVTNRRSGGADEAGRDPTRRSRGELPLLALRGAGGRQAINGLHPRDYNPFNLLIIDSDTAVVGEAAGGAGMHAVELGPGAHVLCVHDVDDPAHAKERRLLARLEDAIARHPTAAQCAQAMTEILRDHSTAGDPRDAACIHGQEYGTVSASMVILGRDGRVRFRQAPGRPCVTRFEDVPPFDAVLPVGDVPLR